MERIEKRIVILNSLRKERINRLLKEYHLTYEDYQIVLALHYAEGISVEEVKQETKIDLRLIDGILNHLQEKEYIYIDKDCIYLTEKTEKLYPQLRKIVKKSNDKFMEKISTDEYHEMIELLDKLIEMYEE